MIVWQDTRPLKSLTVVCSDCDGTGIDAERRPDARHYLHHPSSLCRECRGRGVVEL
jgi:DnaJ-class molecular chaperone